MVTRVVCTEPRSRILNCSRPRIRFRPRTRSRSRARARIRYRSRIGIRSRIRYRSRIRRLSSILICSRIRYRTRIARNAAARLGRTSVHWRSRRLSATAVLSSGMVLAANSSSEDHRPPNQRTSAESLHARLAC